MTSKPFLIEHYYIWKFEAGWILDLVRSQISRVKEIGIGSQFRGFVGMKKLASLYYLGIHFFPNDKLFPFLRAWVGA